MYKKNVEYLICIKMNYVKLNALRHAALKFINSVSVSINEDSRLVMFAVVFLAWSSMRDTAPCNCSSPFL